MNNLMRKKLMPLLLAMLFCVQMLDISALALGSDATDAQLTLVPSASQANPGDTVTISAVGENLEGLQWEVEGNKEDTGFTYDESTATLVVGATQTDPLTVTAILGTLRKSTTITVTQLPETAVNTFTITYDANTGGGSQAADTATENTPLTLPESTTFTAPVDKEFAGWALTQDAGAEAVLGATHTFSEATTVYAVWVPTQVQEAMPMLGATMTGSPVAPIANVVQISFDLNGGTLNPGGTTPEALTIESGISFALPIPNDYYNSITPPAGKTLAGWNTDPSGTALTGFQVAPTQDTVYYAIWDTAYTISFDANGGSGTQNSIIVAADTSLVSLPIVGSGITLTPPEGKIFARWSEDPYALEYEQGMTDYLRNVTKDITLYAIWTTGVTITYDANGGSGTQSSVQVPAHQTTYFPYVSTLTPPAGMVFQGWSLTQDSEILSFFIPTQSTTVYARWSSALPVSFDANGGTGSIDPHTFANGQFVNIGLKLPTPGQGNNMTPPQGKAFLGWSKTPNGDVLDGNEVVFYEATTLYAIWRTPYTISFDANGGSGTMNPVTELEGTSPELPTAGYSVEVTFTPPEGKRFFGWSFSPNGELLNVSLDRKWYHQNSAFLYRMASDVTLYAIWTDTITVNFDANGGGGTQQAIVTGANQVFALPGSMSNSPATVTAPSGTAFAGWSLTPDGAVLYNNQSFAQSTTLYAVWKPVVTITLVPNGGQVSETFEASVQVMAGSVLYQADDTFPNILEPQGQSLKGWSLTPNGATLPDDFVFNSNTTLYPIFTETVTITFVPEIHNTFTVEFAKGRVFDMYYATNTNGDRKFVGWSYTPGGAVIGYQFPVIVPVTLYAIYADPIEIRFDLNGVPGTFATQVLGSGVQLYNTMHFRNMQAYAPPGMYFHGWSTSSVGSPLPLTTAFTTNTVLYAIWGNTPYVAPSSSAMLSPLTGVDS